MCWFCVTKLINVVLMERWGVLPPVLSWCCSAVLGCTWLHLICILLHFIPFICTSFQHYNDVRRRTLSLETPKKRRKSNPGPSHLNDNQIWQFERVQHCSIFRRSIETRSIFSDFRSFPTLDRFGTIWLKKFVY